MQQQHVARGQLSGKSAQNSSRVAAHRVVAAAGPCNIAQAGPRHDRIQEWSAQAGGGAEEHRRPTRNAADYCLRRFYLAPQGAQAIAGEGVRMATGVVLDAVAAPHDIAHDVGIGGDFFADAEEAGLGAMLVKQVEHLWCYLRIRPVIESECYLAAPGSRFR
jgi:hypothetical protein